MAENDDTGQSTDSTRQPQHGVSARGVAGQLDADQAPGLQGQGSPEGGTAATLLAVAASTIGGEVSLSVSETISVTDTSRPW